MKLSGGFVSPGDELALTHCSIVTQSGEGEDWGIHFTGFSCSRSFFDGVSAEKNWNKCRSCNTFRAGWGPAVQNHDTQIFLI